jgi:long-chain acyl-CoA synthetase
MQARAAIASANADNEPAHMQGFVPPPALLLATAKRLGTAAAYHVHTDQGWQATSWQRYGEQVQDAARALLTLGVQHGDGVAILAFNGPAWGILAMAAMAIGAKPVGIYWTSSSADIAHILNHSKAPVLMVDKAERLAAVQACTPPLPHLRHLITLDELPPSAGLPRPSPGRPSWRSVTQPMTPCCKGAWPP